MKLLKEETIAVQNALAQYCRDGKLIDIKGVKKERLHHYRRLVYNVMFGLQEKSYPILCSILSVPEFKELINAFNTKHDAQSVQVWKVPGEFYLFVKDFDSPLKLKYPFLVDLMYMEWMEILVYNRPDREIPKFKAQQPALKDFAVVNPDYDVIELNYPVHKGNYDDIFSLEGRYFLLMFRNVDSNKVHFVEVSALHKDFIEGMTAEAAMDDLIERLIKEYDLYNVPDLHAKLMAFVSKLYSDGFILGIV